ncbi:MAG: hypothetical protein J0M33_23845 [Anaerolineae bacterium]|nr:hypothetical protein [Anaerolineae bacterium]
MFKRPLAGLISVDSISLIIAGLLTYWLLSPTVSNPFNLALSVAIACALVVHTFNSSRPIHTFYALVFSLPLIVISHYPADQKFYALLLVLIVLFLKLAYLRIKTPQLD